MAQTARSRYTYGTYGSAALQRKRQAEPQRAPRPGVRVLPGKGRASERAKSLNPIAIFGFKAVVIAAIVLACVCGLRVWMSVSTVQMMQSVDAIQTEISDARALGNELEIKHSVLSNPTRIQERAAELGMSEAGEVTHITVSLPAKAVTLADGTLSLAGTLQSVQNASLGVE